VRALSREERELMIAASNGYLLAFDNLSGLPVWLSDALCRLATGGSFAVCQLYTDDEEILFDALRRENQLHFFASPGSSARRRAKSALLECFCPSSASWRAAVLGAGLEVIEIARQGAARA
jgi:hypothetical protein